MYWGPICQRVAYDLPQVLYFFSLEGDQVSLTLDSNLKYSQFVLEFEYFRFRLEELFWRCLATDDKFVLLQRLLDYISITIRRLNDQADAKPLLLNSNSGLVFRVLLSKNCAKVIQYAESGLVVLWWKLDRSIYNNLAIDPIFFRFEFDKLRILLIEG